MGLFLEIEDKRIIRTFYSHFGDLKEIDWYGRKKKFLFQDATDLLTEITQFWINLIKLEAVLLV